VMVKYAAYHAWGLGRSRSDNKDELGQPFEELVKDRFLIGSPDDVAEQVLAFNKRIGMNHIVMSMHWPGLAPERTQESLRLFAEEVMPKVAAALA